MEHEIKRQYEELGQKVFSEMGKTWPPKSLDEALVLREQFETAAWIAYEGWLVCHGKPSFDIKDCKHRIEGARFQWDNYWSKK